MAKVRSFQEYKNKENLKTEIFKFQRPVFSTHNTTSDEVEASSENILIYNKDKSVSAYLDMPIEAVKSLFGNKYKIYVLVKYGSQIFDIKKEVEEQEW